MLFLVNVLQRFSSGVNRQNTSPVHSTALDRPLSHGSIHHTDEAFPSELAKEAQEFYPAEQEVGGTESVEQLVEFEQLPLMKSASDRVYRRSKLKPEAEIFQNSTGPVPPEESSKLGALPAPFALTVKGPEGKGRGRVRDYTVLHPSCVSVCNVTIQDSMERGVDECGGATPTELGDSGTFRRRTEPQPPKYSRYRHSAPSGRNSGGTFYY